MIPRGTFVSGAIIMPSATKPKAVLLLDIHVISVIKEGAGERWRAQPGSNLNRLDGVDMAKPYIPYTGPIINRAEAKAKGLKRYFTGKPCKQGHISPKQVSNGNCSECLRERANRFNAENPGVAAQKSAIWRSNNLEKAKGFARRSARNWYLANVEKAAAYHAKKRVERHKEILEGNRRWRKENPELLAAQSRRRRARKVGAEGYHTADDVLSICEKQGWKCASCKKSVKKNRHIDHIVPLARGGTNWPGNLQILCPTCNTKKHAKDPIVWAQSLGRLL